MELYAPHLAGLRDAIDKLKQHDFDRLLKIMLALRDGKREAQAQDNWQRSKAACSVCGGEHKRMVSH